MLVASSPTFERRDNDLYMSMDIPLKSALFGGKVTIETSIHDDITLKVPQNTKNGQKFRVRGKGATDRKTALAGNLYLTANIILPNVDTMDEELKAMLEEKLETTEKTENSDA